MDLLFPASKELVNGKSESSKPPNLDEFAFLGMSRTHATYRPKRPPPITPKMFQRPGWLILSYTQKTEKDEMTLRLIRPNFTNYTANHD